jgi:small subunit ribosomal protein S16
VVAIDQRAKRNGKPIEILGQYDPLLTENKLNIKWTGLNTGNKPAQQASDTVAS